MTAIEALSRAATEPIVLAATGMMFWLKVCPATCIALRGSCGRTDLSDRSQGYATSHHVREDKLGRLADHLCAVRFKLPCVYPD